MMDMGRWTEHWMFSAVHDISLSGEIAATRCALIDSGCVAERASCGMALRWVTEVYWSVALGSRWRIPACWNSTSQNRRGCLQGYLWSLLKFLRICIKSGWTSNFFTMGFFEACSSLQLVTYPCLRLYWDTSMTSLAWWSTHLLWQLGLKSLGGVVEKTAKIQPQKVNWL